MIEQDPYVWSYDDRIKRRKRIKILGIQILADSDIDNPESL